MSTTLSPAVPTHDPDVITRLAGLAQRLDAEPARLTDPEVAVAAILATAEIEEALIAVTHGDVDDQAVSRALAGLDRVELLGDLRRLRSVLTLSVSTAIGLLARVLGGLAPGAPGPTALDELARRLPRSAAGDRRLVTALGPRAWVDELAVADPHAIAATSPYRRSAGHVVASADDRAVEAVMSQRTFTSLRVVDGVLRPGQRLLADLYAPLGRCVALVDENVLEHHGDALTGYFDHHRIELVVLPHRGMEVDKGIRTVERMLGELKAHGVARNEPVLVVGGGVLADTAGLACSLYHRSTPYVMLSTSLVAGIDAGPSPRTCCDGFGYKNLVGAYHPPILSITDRTLFSSLREGWLRHGLAEVAKMAIVDDIELFRLLEEVGPELVTTRFGTVAVDGAGDLGPAASRVIGAALRCYVAAEYDNLYETHQLRPHAYGHTWSPGFEIAAGLLHGHAVSIGMGFGAFLSHRGGGLPDDDLHRILDLLSRLGLSTWHPVLEERELIWSAQERMVEKRGGELFAPVPRGRIGTVGYLDAPSSVELDGALDEYRALATSGPRGGIGIEPHCRDVGLEDPSVIGVDHDV